MIEIVSQLRVPEKARLRFKIVDLRQFTDPMWSAPWRTVAKRMGFYVTGLSAEEVRNCSI